MCMCMAHVLLPRVRCSVRVALAATPHKGHNTPTRLCTVSPHRHQPSSGTAMEIYLDSGNADVARDAWPAALLLAAGSDPYTLLDAAVSAAGAIAGAAVRFSVDLVFSLLSIRHTTHGNTSSEYTNTHMRARMHAGRALPHSSKQRPQVLSNYLGWCTWDAAYTQVCAAGIDAGLTSFAAAGVRPRWLIVDDGWQRTALDGTKEAAQAGALQAPEATTGAVRGASPPVTQAIGGAPGSSGQRELRSHALDLPTHPNGELRSLYGRLARATGSTVRRLQLALLHAVSAAADRLNWWATLRALLRQPLLGSLLKSLLCVYNRCTSEHSKRLMAPGFNAKFS